MAPRLATQLTGALPSNPTTTWDAYGKDGATAYGTFSPMQGIMQPVSPGTGRYSG